jgi:hypothetical protein
MEVVSSCARELRGGLSGVKGERAQVSGRREIDDRAEGAGGFIAVKVPGDRFFRRERVLNASDDGRGGV